MACKARNSDYAFKRPVIVYMMVNLFLNHTKDPLCQTAQQRYKRKILKYVNDGTWKSEQEYLRVEQMLGKENIGSRVQQMVKRKVLTVEDVYTILSDARSSVEMVLTIWT